VKVDRHLDLSETGPWLGVEHQCDSCSKVDSGGCASEKGSSGADGFAEQDWMRNQFHDKLGAVSISGTLGSRGRKVDTVATLHTACRISVEQSKGIAATRLMRSSHVD
jgi:hypothetical protein